MPAWNGWYHLMTNTFGTWLPGDPRGFRSRHHRLHVEGDYKSPPPAGRYIGLHHATRLNIPHEPIVFSGPARECAVRAIVYALNEVHNLEILALAVSSMHMHALLRIPGARRQKPTLSKRGYRGSALDDPARHYLGIAKKESAKDLVRHGLAAPGGVWAKRGKVVPIRDRAHQVRVYKYILEHIEESAAVWSFKEPGVVRTRGRE